MKLLTMTLLLVHLTSIQPKRYRGSSSESIENILYYKDCSHKQSPTTKPSLRAYPAQPECKMRCSMCCGDQCVDNQKLSSARQDGWQGQSNIEPKIQPDIKPQIDKKKIKPKLPLIPPLRRGLAFTRENVKNLISKDEDIKKILRDLVRVAMQKVDLMQLLNIKQSAGKRDSDRSEGSESENDL